MRPHVNALCLLFWTCSSLACHAKAPIDEPLELAKAFATRHCGERRADDRRYPRVVVLSPSGVAHSFECQGGVTPTVRSVPMPSSNVVAECFILRHDKPNELAAMEKGTDHCHLSCEGEYAMNTVLSGTGYALRREGDAFVLGERTFFWLS